MQIARRPWIAIATVWLAVSAGCGERVVPSIDAYFSPAGGCTDAAVKQIHNARSKILVQAYSFTSIPITTALTDAKRRGVDVHVILDKSQETAEYTSATHLLNEGVPTLIDHQHEIAHNKIMVIDGETVITGSFNFTRQAEQHNAENLLVIYDPDLAAKYAANWQLHAAHSVPYTGPKAPEHGGSRDSRGAKTAGSHHPHVTRPQ